MTTEEFSNKFDVILDSYKRFKSYDEKESLDSLDFNEYEKSVFLTKAQNEVVKEVYTGNNSNISFELTEEARSYLRPLIVEYTTTPENNTVEIPKDLLYITYEECSLKDNFLDCPNLNKCIVIPVKQDELYNIQNNPFKGPSNKRVLRVDKNNKLYLISNKEIQSYTCYYLRIPKPIILIDLEDVTINGISKVTECELNEFLQEIILDRAVKLAIISKTQTSINKQN